MMDYLKVMIMKIFYPVFNFMKGGANVNSVDAYPSREVEKLNPPSSHDATANVKNVTCANPVTPSIIQHIQQYTVHNYYNQVANSVWTQTTDDVGAKPPSAMASEVEHQPSTMSTQDHIPQSSLPRLLVQNPIPQSSLPLLLVQDPIPQSSLPLLVPTTSDVQLTEQHVDGSSLVRAVNPKPKTDLQEIQVVQSPNQLSGVPSDSDLSIDTRFSGQALLFPTHVPEAQSPAGTTERPRFYSSNPLTDESLNSPNEVSALNEDIPSTVSIENEGDDSADEFEDIYDWPFETILDQLSRDCAHTPPVDVPAIHESDRKFLACKLSGHAFNIWPQEQRKVIICTADLNDTVKEDIKHHFEDHHNPPLMCSFKSPVLQAVHLGNHAPVKNHQFFFRFDRNSSSSSSGPPLMYEGVYGWNIVVTTAAHMVRDVLKANKFHHLATEEGSAQLTNRLATSINDGKAMLYVKEGPTDAAVHPVMSPVICEYSTSTGEQSWSFDSLFARVEFPSQLLQQPDKLRELIYINNPGVPVGLEKLEVRGILRIETKHDVDRLQQKGVLLYCACANLMKGKIVPGPSIELDKAISFKEDSFITVRFDGAAFGGWSGGPVYVLLDNSKVLMLVGHVISKVSYCGDEIIEGSTQHVELVQIQPLWPFIIKLKRLYPNLFKGDIITVYEYLHRLKLEQQKTVSHSNTNDSGFGFSIIGSETSF